MSLLENSTEGKLKRGRRSEGEIEGEGKEDRISDLPDSVLLHILSFVECRTVVQTCVFSRRWKDLWKHLPSLILRCPPWGTDKVYRKFVSRVLHLRDDSLALHTLDYQRHCITEPRLLGRVISYAVSHNVQHLGIEAVCDDEQMLASIFSCQTLTSLNLSISHRDCHSENPTFPVTLNFRALTSLHLEFVAFSAIDNGRAEPFSGCKSLNHLVLKNCKLGNATVLCISSDTLSNLAIHLLYLGYYEIVLSTPNLHSFTFDGVPCQHLSGSGLSSVEQVHIDAYIMSCGPELPLFMLVWLIQLRNVKSLTVSASTLQVLFLIPGLLEIKLPSLGNLKTLKVILKPLSRVFAMILKARKSWKAKMNPSSPIPDGMVNFLCQNSSSAEVSFEKRQS